MDFKESPDGAKGPSFSTPRAEVGVPVHVQGVPDTACHSPIVRFFGESVIDIFSIELHMIYFYVSYSFYNLEINIKHD